MSTNALERLKSRSQRLALKPLEEKPGQSQMTLFRRGGQLYALPIEHVEGASRVRELSPIPDGLPWMVGATLYKGEVLTLVDLLSFWGALPQGIADLPSFLVLSSGGQRVGLLVEELLGMQEVDDASTRYEGVERVALTHVGRLKGEPVLVLSAKELLSDDRFQP
jgi:purine-binding chemotaxis protein CheW